MAKDPENAFKTYIQHSFEKSVHKIVTYLGKIWSKSHFPEGGEGQNTVVKYNGMVFETS